MLACSDTHVCLPDVLARAMPNPLFLQQISYKLVSQGNEKPEVLARARTAGHGPAPGAERIPLGLEAGKAFDLVASASECTSGCEIPVTSI